MLLAHEYGYENVLIFIDNGEKGNTFDRPGLNALKAAVEEVQIEAVLVHSLSRIGRDFLKTHDFIMWLQQKRVVLVSLTEGDLTAKHTRAMLRLLDAVINAK